MTGTNPRVAPDLIREHSPKLATHLAFYVGWLAGMTAVNILAKVPE